MTERTPQDVLREAAALLRAVEDACPVCHGTGWTVDPDPSDPSGATPMQVPCWDAEHSVILNRPWLASAIAEAPDSPHDKKDKIIERLTTALRVATHKPHDQLGEPNEGFPVCSVCGAIQTAPDTLSEKPGLNVERLTEALAHRFRTLGPPLDSWTDEMYRREAASLIRRAGLGSTDSEGQ